MKKESASGMQKEREVLLAQARGRLLYSLLEHAMYAVPMAGILLATFASKGAVDHWFVLLLLVFVFGQIGTHRRLQALATLVEQALQKGENAARQPDAADAAAPRG